MNKAYIIQSGARTRANCSCVQPVNVSNNVKIGDGIKVQDIVSIYEGIEFEDYVFCASSCVVINDLIPRARHLKGHARFLVCGCLEGGQRRYVA